MKYHTHEFKEASGHRKIVEDNFGYSFLSKLMYCTCGGEFRTPIGTNDFLSLQDSPSTE